MPRSKISQLLVATDYYHVFISPIHNNILTLKRLTFSRLLLYIKKDRYSIFPMNIGPYYFKTTRKQEYI